MPYGVLADIFCIILGGIIGPNLNIKITYKYREPLIKIFGISALAIGIISFIKVNCLPCGYFSFNFRIYIRRIFRFRY